MLKQAGGHARAGQRAFSRSASPNDHHERRAGAVLVAQPLKHVASLFVAPVENSRMLLVKRFKRPIRLLDQDSRVSPQQIVERLPQMHAEALREPNRFVVGIVRSQIMAFRILELLADELLG